MCAPLKPASVVWNGTAAVSAAEQPFLPYMPALRASQSYAWATSQLDPTSPGAGEDAPSLPRSLGEALDGLEKSPDAQRWLGPVFLEAYLRHKRSELAHVAGLGPPELCARYAAVY